jgi:hypothetical protein
MLRHMAAELKRKDAKTTVLAMHPGEVLTYVPFSRTCHPIPSPRPPLFTQNSCTINVTQIADSYLKYSDMTNIDADLPIEGLLTPQESVEKMLAVIPGKTIDDTGTFWTWEGKVITEPFHLQPILLALVSKQLLTKPFADTSVVKMHLPVPFFRIRSSLNSNGKGWFGRLSGSIAQHNLRNEQP